MRVKITTSPGKEGFFTVSPHGPIDSDTYLEFQNSITPLLVKSTKGICMDLADVDYVSSAGLGVFFNVNKVLSKNDGTLIFSNLKPQIKRLFEIVKALPPEILFENAAEADAYFYKMMNEEIERQKDKP